MQWQPQLCGHNLPCNCRMALALRHGAQHDRDDSLGINADAHMLGRAGLAAAGLTIRLRRGKTHVPDIGCRRVDDGCQPDADQFPAHPRLSLSRTQPDIVRVLQGHREGAGVIAGVVDAPAGRRVREGIGSDHVPATNLGRVQLAMDGDLVDETFQPEIELLPAETAVEAGRCLVRHDCSGANLQGSDAIRPGQVAETPVQRAGLRGAEIGADVVHQVHPQRADDAEVVDCRLEDHLPVRAGLLATAMSAT
jgi:hypothetical protein